jgi:hypothetical protein
MQIKVLKIGTGKEVGATISRLEKNDLNEIKKRDVFDFDWSKKLSYQVYKIYLTEDEKILGLIALEDIPAELRIHIDLIESSSENVGKNKKIDRVPGSLIAFACELSFKKGYEGFVSLIPKTALIDHYINKYGFRQFGRQLALEGRSAGLLIIKYLDYEL